MSLAKTQKEEIVKEFGRHQKDTGSPEVQIALTTTRILELTDHLKEHTHDESSRMGLLKLVGQRRRLLAYLRKEDYQRYIAISDSLGLRRK
ncbi:MAG: 30S ribosomal protein S15 [Anaerolineales bacterium]|nr:30S ribosomal protein S15 [Anaerolineales bacterium]